MDSQILSSPRSLSIASEPSDLKNWFPSYQYESPAVNSSSFLDDTVVPETEMEENSGGFERSGTKNEAFIPKNETPNGVVKCGSFSGYEHESHLLSKTPGPLQPPSQLSEPTDIKNWFPSYVYESPSFDTSTINSHGENEEDLEGYNKRTDGEAVADLQSEGLAKCITSWRDNKQKTQPGRPSYGVSENLLSQNDLRLKHMPKSWKTKVIALAQDVEMSTLNKETSQCKLSPKTIKGTKIKPSDDEKSPCRNYEKSSQDMTPSKAFTFQENSEAEFHTEVDCILTGSDSDLIPSNGVSERKPTHGSTDRKDDGNEISENGFVTTRKGKLTRNIQEKIVERPQEISKMTAPIVAKRKALADATNIHHSPAAGITGQWKCPQKSKPNRGPTLKQLRLEKWVRKL